MAVVLVLLGVVIFVCWAVWHERNLRRQEVVIEEQQEILVQQRRQLDEQMMHERAQARKESASEALSRFEAGEDAVLDDIADLLHVCPETDQWRLLGALNRQLMRRYSGNPLSAPLPQDLLRLLAVLSGRPKGYRQQGELRDCLSFEQIHWQGLEMKNLNLRGATLSDCRFSEARLAGIDLFAARLQAVSFAKSRLTGINLTGATLNQCDFEACDLSGAELITAELVDCSLRGCDLSGAALRGVRMSGCDLRGAKLSKATGLSFAMLLSCRLDANTVLPANLQPRLNELLLRSQA